MDVLQEITAARADVLARIDAAAKGAGRGPAEVQLVAVSKSQPDERIAAMLATGQRVFGENRVQEAEAHWEARRASCTGRSPTRSRAAVRRLVAAVDAVATRHPPGEALARRQVLQARMVELVAAEAGPRLAQHMLGQQLQTIVQVVAHAAAADRDEAVRGVRRAAGALVGTEPPHIGIAVLAGA